MEMVAGEKVLLQSNEGSIVLTTHRVRFSAETGGQGQTVSMTLDAVASCGLVTKSYPLLLVIAGFLSIAALLAALRGEGGIAVMGFLFAAVPVVAYFVTREVVLEIRSMGGDKIQVAMKAKHEAVIPFVDAVENAKLALLEGVQRASSVRSTG